MNRHVPVLLRETVEALNLKPDTTVVDGTLGDAGHAEEILKYIMPKGVLIGIDVDAESILRAKKFLYDFGDKVIFERDNFKNIKTVLKKNNREQVSAILLDLGWSMPQFQERGRGFSFLNRDEPLDMRFDTYLKCEHMTDEPPQSFDGKPLYGPCTAAELVNNMSKTALTTIFKNYGEEKLSKEIAEAIIEKRKDFALESVGDMVNIVLDIYRKKLKTEKEIPWIGGLHPATKIFQALRIAVNMELDVLKYVIPDAIEMLASGGRLVIISFHSLEDRIVKHAFKDAVAKGLGIVINKKPITCSQEEYDKNPPSRSAKLRIFERSVK